MQIVGGYQAMDKASPLAFRQALMSKFLISNFFVNLTQKIDLTDIRV